MRFRTAFPFALLLALPTLAHAQSRDSAFVKAIHVSTDSLIRLDSTVMKPWCALKATTATRKAECVTQARLHRRIDSTATAFWPRVATTPAPTPTPTPTPTPVPAPVDSTPKDTTVVKPDTAPPVVIVTPGPTPGPIAFTHPFGPPANGAVLATLPQATVDASYPAITRRYACSNLQACLDTAQTGDEVLLAPGANFRDAIVKPTARAAWAVVRTNIPDSVLGTGRMTKARADALNLATIHSSGGSVPAITVASGAHHIRFVGIRVVPDATATNALVRVGLGETTVAQLPHHVTLDRVVIDGDTNEVRRCIAFDGDYLALLSSTLANCHAKNNDSQGVLKIHGRGPMRIENNAIAAGHQSVFLGGGDPSIRGIVPADIVIRRNDLSRPLSWKGVWQVKTNIELKIGKRVLIEGNVICHTWHDAQAGYAILLKTENQDGGTSGDWSETSDVTVRDNRLCGAAGGINLAALPNGPGVPMSRVTIYGNVADSIGVAPYAFDTGEALLNQGVADVVYRDNWTRNAGRACLYLSGVSQRFVGMTNVCSGQYGIYGENGGPTVAAPGGIITGNTVLPTSTAFSAWPPIPADSTRSALLSGVVVP